MPAYEVIQLPLPLNRLDAVARPELESFGRWFVDVIPSRISMIEAAVRATEGHESWRAALDPPSLRTLGLWFEGKVAARPKSEEELREAKAQLAFSVDVPEQQLTNETLSMAIDIGMYLGETVVRNADAARWQQSLTSRTMADYGRMVVVGLALPMDPVRILTTVAYGIVRRAKPANLLKLYESWTSRVVAPPRR